MGNISADIFDTDEKIYLNHASKDVLPDKLTREHILQGLNFAAKASNSDDFLISGLLRGLIDKFSRLEDNEWDKIKTALPFHVPYGGEDNKPYEG